VSVAIRMTPTGVDIIDALLLAAVREAVRDIMEARGGSSVYVELWYYPDEDRYEVLHFSYAAQPSVVCSNDEMGPLIAAAYMVGSSPYAEGEAWIWWIIGCGNGVVAEVEKRFLRRVVAVWGEE